MNKKNIAILTINDDNNYGNRLQNYAVQETLKSLGHNVETILNLEDFWSGNKMFLLEWKIKTIIKHFINKPRFRRYINFQKFNKNIKFSKISIDDNHIPSNLNEYYDYFITGSDQVWNPNFARLSYIDLLSFAESKKRISFSASFGISELPEKYHEIARKELTKFKAVSVRENSAQKIIEEVVGRNDSQVLVDPTMLLNQEKWNEVISKPKKIPKKKYILNYFLGDFSQKRQEEIEKIAKKYDCEIINILNNEDPYFVSGPGEFLYLEKNAFLINTDSFHSCVFAILFDRPFIVYDREDNACNMSTRIVSLLSKFKLESRKYNDKSIENMLEHDYSEAYKILEKERKKSFDFLNKVLK